jgi:hypothetical protein
MNELKLALVDSLYTPCPYIGLLRSYRVKKLMRVKSNLKACCSCLVNKILFLSINFYIFLQKSTSQRVML